MSTQMWLAPLYFRRALQITLVVGSLFVMRAADATVYDAVADFNTTGVQTVGATWTYGSETSLSGGGFSLIPNFGSLVCNSSDNTCTPTGATQLAYSTSGAYAGPPANLEYNAFGGTITYPVGSQANGVGVNSTVVFPNNVVALSPSGELEVVRFTAPTGGIYDITGFFLDLQAASDGLDIVVDGTLMFQDLTSFTGAATLQGSVPFSLTDIDLAAGGTIDFIVDGTYPGGTNDDSGPCRHRDRDAGARPRAKFPGIAGIRFDVHGGQTSEAAAGVELVERIVRPSKRTKPALRGIGVAERLSAAK